RLLPRRDDVRLRLLARAARPGDDRLLVGLHPRLVVGALSLVVDLRRRLAVVVLRRLVLGLDRALRRVLAPVLEPRELRAELLREPVPLRRDRLERVDRRAVRHVDRDRADLAFLGDERPVARAVGELLLVGLDRRREVAHARDRRELRPRAAELVRDVRLVRLDAREAVERGLEVLPAARED